MKAIIEIELDNAAFGDSPAERLFEMENITEKLMANAARIMAVDVGAHPYVDSDTIKIPVTQ